MISNTLWRELTASCYGRDTSWRESTASFYSCDTLLRETTGSCDGPVKGETHYGGKTTGSCDGRDTLWREATGRQTWQIMAGKCHMQHVSPVREIPRNM